jgi:hypothetical protein
MVLLLFGFGLDAVGEGRVWPSKPPFLGCGCLIGCTVEIKEPLVNLLPTAGASTLFGDFKLFRK